MKGEVNVAGQIMWMGNDGILRQTFVPNAEIHLQDAKAAFAMRIELSKGRKHPYFIDMTNLKKISREGRVYGTTDEVRDLTSALALLTGSFIGKMIGNFFVGIQRPPYPTRLFTSEAEAINWLRGFIV